MKKIALFFLFAAQQVLAGEAVVRQCFEVADRSSPVDMRIDLYQELGTNDLSTEIINIDESGETENPYANNMECYVNGNFELECEQVSRESTYTFTFVENGTKGILHFSDNIPKHDWEAFFECSAVN